MTQEGKLTGRRRGAVMVFGLVVIVAIAAVAIVVEYKEHMGAGTFGAEGSGMELRGVWLGLWVAGTDSQSARRFGIPQSVKGVVVTDIGQGPDARAAGLGIAPGDVLARVGGQTVDDLQQLYATSARLDLTQPVQLDLLRQGQPFSVMLAPSVDPAVRPAAFTQNGWVPGPPQQPAQPAAQQVPYGANGWGYGPGQNPNCPQTAAWSNQ